MTVDNGDCVVGGDLETQKTAEDSKIDVCSLKV